MKRKIFFLAAVLTYCFNSSGQNYTSSIGIRLGTFSGFSAKHFINNKNAFEGQVSLNQDGFLGTGLFEFQKPTSNVNRLDWFIGGGAHAGFLSKYYGYLHDNNKDYSKHWDSVIGVDFIAGFEYVFETVPFTIGLDVKPSVNFFGHSPFFFDMSLMFRYYFD
jgi:hypothetical protein